MKTLLLLYFLILTTSARAQDVEIAWQKTLGGSGLEFAAEHSAAADGGYVILATTGSTDGDLAGAETRWQRSNGSTDAWLVKLDKDRNIMWQRIYGGTRSDTAISLYPTQDGGYLLNIRSHSIDFDFAHSFDSDFAASIIVKTDANGTIDWTRRFNANKILAIGQLTDGLYIFSATHRDGGMFGALDDTGGVAWLKPFRSELASFYNHPQDILETANGFVVCGIMDEFHWIGKYLDRGQVIWEYNIVDPFTTGSSSMIIPLAAGGYAIIGTHVNYDLTNYTVFYTCDSMGILEVKRHYEPNTANFGISNGIAIATTDDAGFIMAGVIDSAFGVKDIVVRRTDSLGNVLWQKVMGGASLDYPTRSITDESKAQYTFSGTTSSNDGNVQGNDGGTDIWLFSLRDDVAHTPSAEDDVFVVAPNPALTAISVKLNEPMTITIHDILGRAMKTFGVFVGVVTLNIGDLPGGAYVVTASNGNGAVLRSRFIKL